MELMKNLVVNVETLTFKPVLRWRLQTARRGIPFIPENIHGWGREGEGVEIGVGVLL